MNSNSKPSWKAVQKAWQAEQREFQNSKEFGASAEVVGRALYKIRMQGTAGSAKEEGQNAHCYASFFQMRDWAWGACASIVLSVVVALPFTAMHQVADQQATASSEAFVSELFADSVLEVTLE